MCSNLALCQGRAVELGFYKNVVVVRGCPSSSGQCSFHMCLREKVAHVRGPHPFLSVGNIEHVCRQLRRDLMVWVYVSCFLAYGVLLAAWSMFLPALYCCIPLHSVYCCCPLVNDWRDAAMHKSCRPAPQPRAFNTFNTCPTMLNEYQKCSCRTRSRSKPSTTGSLVQHTRLVVLSAVVCM